MEYPVQYQLSIHVKLINYKSRWQLRSRTRKKSYEILIFFHNLPRVCVTFFLFERCNVIREAERFSFVKEPVEYYISAWKEAHCC